MHRFIVGIGIITLIVWPGGTFAQTVPLLPDGTLVRAEGDARVYLIDDGQKRWVDSPETIRIQGLRWEIVTVSATELGRYPDGERLTAQSTLILPGEAEVLPDLAPLGAGNFHLITSGGRKLLKFTASFSNLGKGPFELFTRPGLNQPADNTYHTAYQHIVRPDGTVRDKIVGSLLFHRAHDHYHHADFADYKLEMVRPAPGSPATAEAVTAKTTYCMRDDLLIAPDLPGAPKSSVYAGCGQLKQGVSVGWTDVYSYTLPDQHFDVTGLPSGVYKVSFFIDPRHHFVEGRADNNVSVSLVDLDAASGIVRVLLDGAVFATSWNRYTDGMLVRAEGDNRAYLIHNGKKRWIRTEEIFLSYGRAWGEVYELPASVVAAIPSTRLVRPTDSPDIFMINDGGFRRRILNPAVFGSYGFTARDVAEINQTEFAAYVPTDLIMRAGDQRVYSIDSRRFVGTFASLPALGRDMAAVHLVNDTDFDAYAVQVVARNLTVPWDIVFLPDGDMLVTERPGTLRRIGKNPATIALPSVLHVGEGGLMGMALHPDFGTNRFIYLYFTIDESGRSNRVTRFRLDGDQLVEDRVIIDGIPAALYHDGGQVAFGPDGMLYLTTGDAGDPNLSQNLASLAGKTLRLTPEGGVPADNPFGTPVWSFGHRNAQGIAWDARGRMWQTEHGRSGALSGFDELNLVEKGKNYGWPTFQGDQTGEGMTPPALHSGATVTWAPSGIAYAGGKLFFAGLRGSSLYAATVGDGGNITDFRPHLANTYGRLRAVVLGPDGFLYVSTSNRDGRGTVREGDDKILRVHQDFLRE